MDSGYADTYAGEMSRPTNWAKRLAGPLGASPSTVQGWLDSDFEPSQSLAPGAEVEHFRAVSQYLGQGHVADVATLQLADDGRATVRLRRVLREMNESLTV